MYLYNKNILEYAEIAVTDDNSRILNIEGHSNKGLPKSWTNYIQRILTYPNAKIDINDSELVIINDFLSFHPEESDESINLSIQNVNEL